MVTRLSHATIFVLDQEVALDFYVSKLGFSVSMDFPMGHGFRWLTVHAPKQPDLEIILMKVDGGEGSPMSEGTANSLKDIMNGHGLGVGVLECDDCHKTYQELVAKGVKFTREPQEQFYGIEALFEDPFGNWFSMTERKKNMELPTQG